MKFIDKVKSNKTKLLAFCIPVTVMVIVYYIIGIYPFGEKSLLTQDLDGQYIQYFGAYKDAFLGGKSIFYTFSKALGGNMIGLFAYYLASPLNIIFLIFPKENFTEAVLLLTLLKVGLCGFTFNFYLQYKFKRKGLYNLIFSTTYALMTYNIVYQQNIMWLDGVIFLPLIMIGILKLVENKGLVMYIVFLGISIISNWYIGYMLCIFSLIYFLYELVIVNFIDNKGKIKSIFKFIGSSLLAVGLSAWILVPSAMSLQNDKGNFNLQDLKLNSNFDIFDIFSKYIIGSYNFREMVDGLPNIFCGFLILILVIVYFFNNKINKKEKIASMCLIGIFILSFNISTFNVIWHGFKFPSWFTYRYAFLFSAILIIIAYKSYINLNNDTNRNIINSAIFILVIILIVDKFNYDYLNDWRQVWLSCLFVILYSIILLSKKNSIRKTLLMVIVFELTLNATICLKRVNYTERSNYKNYVSAINQIKSTLDDESNIYRTGIKAYRSPNDSMLFGTNGISHFSSTGEKYIKDFIGYIGMRNQSIATVYSGDTPVSNSYLGIKNIITRDETKIYEYKTQKDGLKLYENKFALPLIFTADNDLIYVNLNRENPILLQNNILKGITGNDVLAFRNIKACKITKKNAEEKNGKYKKININENASIELEFDLKERKDIFTYLNKNIVNQAKIIIDGKELDSFEGLEGNYILNIGSKEKFNVRLELKNEMMNKDIFSVYWLNIDDYENQMDKIKSNNLKVIRNTGDCIQAEINVEKNRFIASTIPFSEEWKVKIDDIKVKPMKILDTFIGIKVEPGYHRIELIYVPKGLKLGVIVSIISTLVVIYISIKSRLNKKPTDL
ncbi:YfhO family protein [Clostridium sp. LY3-2]|uniref:YfhO family protein n=1 Tax=Clostridium sp. LY3-2 TaxID=2942482 RepID=UPI00215221CF|nr:YfhO family protein [Clostridium sp. LY3-2]MCR6513707.1 YfhO family protein [Clostridium sp. LY3-2]